MIFAVHLERSMSLHQIMYLLPETLTGPSPPVGIKSQPTLIDTLISSRIAP